MDISFSPRAEAFRAELRAWLAANLPPDWGSFASRMSRSEEERFAIRIEWERKLHAGGYACPHWPVEYGGRGLGMEEMAVFYEEMGRAGALELVSVQGKNMLGPTLIHHGTEWQKRRFLPKILSNEELWCQGFSEPNAGSDLAGLQTRAVLENDEWVITGQKIWTSGAQYADWCFCLARTDPRAPRHQGITFLLVPMKQAGITVRPLRQITGDAEFAEVFFDGARTPRDHVVGAVNGGWQVAMALLGHERGGIAIARQALLRGQLDRIVAYARNVPRHPYRRASEDPYIRQRIAELDIRVENLRLTNYRYLTRDLAGEEPGARGSVARLELTTLWQAMAELALELAGPFAQVAETAGPAATEGELVYDYLLSRGATIAGGTSEIQRNIIAERLLGLPR